MLIKEGPSVDYYNMYERNDSGKPEGNVFVGGSNKTAQGTALTINTWTHLASTYDGTNVKLYVNGTAGRDHGCHRCDSGVKRQHSSHWWKQHLGRVVSWPD